MATTSNTPQDELRRSWHRQARGLQRRVNLHHWLARLLPVATGVSLIFACLLLWVRGQQQATEPWWAAFAVALVLASLGAAWLARRSWIDFPTALVRLESQHRLHNQLSAAEAGVMPWPELPEKVQDGFALAYRRVLVPPLAAIVFLMAAASIQLPALALDPTTPAAEPLAWNQVDSMIERLEEEQLFDQRQLDQYRDKLDALRDQPQDEWYEHGSLEAGESLKNDFSNALEETAREMEMAEQHLDTMQKEAEKVDASLEELTQQLNQTAEALEMGDLSLDQQTLEQLKQMAQNVDPKQLSQEQLQQLKERMKQGAQTAKQCLGDGGQASQSLAERLANAEQVRRLRPGEEGEGDRQDQLGKGRPGRGPGHAPFSLMQTPSDANSKRFEKVNPTDFSRATLGETEALEARQHQVDPSTYQGPASAGEVEGKGAGGETVWRNNLTPEENQVLQNYFR